MVIKVVNYFEWNANEQFGESKSCTFRHPPHMWVAGWLEDEEGINFFDKWANQFVTLELGDSFSSFYSPTKISGQSRRLIYFFDKFQMQTTSRLLIPEINWPRVHIPSYLNFLPARKVRDSVTKSVHEGRKRLLFFLRRIHRNAN